MKNVSTNLNNLKKEVVKLDVPNYLSKLSDAVKNDVVKKDVYDAKIKSIKDKIPDVNHLAANASLELR